MEKEEMEKIKRNMQYGKDLQQQMVSRQQQRQCDYEDTLIENKMLEEVTRTMADEDQRELEKKREGTERMRQEMVASMAERVAWKDKQKQMIINEERHIEEQGNTVADRSTAVIAERERKIHANDEHNQRIGAQLLVDDAARHERENLIELLQEQEYLEKNAQDDIDAKEKSDRVRKDMMDCLTDQMDTKKREVQRQKDMDVVYRKESEAISTAEDAKDREKALKIKEKGRQYSEDLLKQIEGNAVRRAKEHKEEEAWAQHVWDYDKSWSEEVSEERKKIVSEHGAQVLGSLQAAVLAPGDLPAVQEGAADPTLAHLHISDTEHSHDVRHPKCNAQCRILREY